MGAMRCVGLAAIAALALFCRCEPALAEVALRCGHFTQDQMPAPEPREAQAARKRFEEINASVKTQPYRVLFFGVSLTERFETWDAPGSTATAPSTCCGGSTTATLPAHRRRALCYGSAPTISAMTAL